MAENRIERMFASDPSTSRFHVGSAPQAGIPDDLSDEEQEALTLHRAQIHTLEPRPRFAELQGAPVPTPGLVIADPATGTVKPLDVDARGKVRAPTRASAKK